MASVISGLFLFIWLLCTILEYREGDNSFFESVLWGFLLALTSSGAFTIFIALVATVVRGFQ